MKLHSYEEQAKLIKQRQQMTNLDQAYSHFRQTYDVNLQAMELFIEIFHKKRDNIDSSLIKSIYKMFSQGKANQIMYEKAEKCSEDLSFESSKSQLFLQRYYARLVELGIQKISYFWQNSKALDFLAPKIVELTKCIKQCLYNAEKTVDLKINMKLLKYIYEQNALIEKKIYEKLIQDGYLCSMDEFYRINGVDIVKDQYYERKKSGHGPRYKRKSQLKAEIQQESLGKNINIEKKQANKEILNKSSHSPRFLEKNMKKIKISFQAMMSIIKKNLPVQKIPKTSKVFEGFQRDQHSNRKTKIEKRSTKLEGKELNLQQTSENNRRETTNIDKKVQQQSTQRKSRVNIEMLSYFSSSFKSAINQTDSKELGIDLLGLLLMKTSNNFENQKKSSANRTQIIRKNMNSVKRTQAPRFVGMALRQNFLKSLNDTSNSSKKDIFESSKYYFPPNMLAKKTVEARKDRQNQIHQKSIDRKAQALTQGKSQSNKVDLKRQESVFENTVISKKLSEQSSNIKNSSSLIQNLNLCVLASNFGSKQIGKQKNKQKCKAFSDRKILQAEKLGKIVLNSSNTNRSLCKKIFKFVTKYTIDQEGEQYQQNDQP